MGSQFVTIDPPKSKRTSFLGKTMGFPMEVWFQFVPGKVLDVITSHESAAYQSPGDINAIIAKSHMGSGASKPNFKSTQTTKYFPLLRGMSDCPAKGDPVLLATFAGVNYFLGPLNSTGNVNFNPDPINIKDPSTFAKGLFAKVSAGMQSGQSRNFKPLPVARRQKFINKELDSPEGVENKGINELGVGDLMLEGRYGNSIRLGSRDIAPHLIISNGRSTVANSTESTIGDSSIIAMLEKGKLHHHFPWDAEVEGETTIPKPYVLSSDSEEVKSERPIGKDVYDYEYKEPQLFIRSDKVTIDSRKQSIFLSAFQHIHIGAGQTLTINTNNETIIESKNIYLGKKAMEKKQPIVLGTKLKEFLEELIGVVETMKVTAIPYVTVSGTPTPDVMAQLSSLKSKLAQPEFWSSKHYIEEN
tara:strand:- start:3480 stop:4727 length:1248 start_codon:yes stop_codon:yes gene_type:complete